MSACYPVDLYLISEKTIWRSQVWQTGFLVYLDLDFYCLCSLQKSILKLIFTGYTGSKNQVGNRLKIQFVELDFSKLIFQKSSTDQQGDFSVRGYFAPQIIRSLRNIWFFINLKIKKICILNLKRYKHFDRLNNKITAV